MTANSSALWQNRNFVRFLSGQFATNAGNSLYAVAVLWLVYELSGSTAMTGAANAILLLPWLLEILAGPVVDRFPIRRVLVGSQLVQGIAVLVIPLAALTGQLSLGVVFLVLPVLAIATLPMAPIRTALVPKIVAEERLSRANAALKTVNLGMDMIFDALGGIFIAVVGATTLILLDAATFVLAAVLFVGIQTGSTEAETEEGHRENSISGFGSDIRAGIDLLRGTVFVELLALTAISNFTTGVTLAVLPAFGDALGGPVVYGLLLGALGIGRLVGSVVGPAFEGIRYGRFLAIAFTLASTTWVASILAPSPGMTVVLFGVAWIPAGISGVLGATLNQTVFPTNALGRITAIKGTAAGATLPIGSLIGGVIGTWLGPHLTVVLAAAGFGMTGVYATVRPRIRHLPAVSEATPSDFDVDLESGDFDSVHSS